MATPRIFVPAIINEPSSFTLTDKKSIHKIHDVLRLKKDSTLILFNGQGGEFEASIVQLSKDQIVCNINRRIERSSDTKFKVILGLPIIKEAQLEIALQKATELGVDSIVVYPAEHSYKKSISLERQKRFERIVQEAARQSERAILSILSYIESLEAMVSGKTDICRLYLECRQTTSEQIVLRSVKQASEIMIIVGPEGDFSTAEKELLRKNQVIPWSLPVPILRAETAAFFSVGLVKYLHNLLKDNVLGDK